MLKVPYGQDPYSVIGKYIRDHITAIEDIIAVIEIDDITTNQLFMVDMNEENYFIWENDWYEGEKNVALIDFFPVSEAINPSAHPEPCEDAVSRKLMYELGATCMARRDENGELVALGSLDVLPTIEERKTGKWVKVHGYCTPGGDPVWACSECGKGIHVYGIEHGTYGADVSDGQWKACPNCSALMEGEQHG